MNREFVYLIAEALYLNTTAHPLCNRNWLFAIYKSLLVANENDTEEIKWNQYSQWKIDHNCRAAKSIANQHQSKIEQMDIDWVSDYESRIRVIFKKGEITTTQMTCFYKSESFIPGMWTFRNPKNESVLLSAYERDELFKASLREYQIEESLVINDRKNEKSDFDKVYNDLIGEYVPDEFSPKPLRDNYIRDMKFTALHNLLESMRGTYNEMISPDQRSFIEVVFGAAIFYLPSLHAHFNGYISIKALKGFLKKERKVKDHIYPRKLAARELLANPMTLEELKNRYHDHLATYMYITSEENGLLVNYYEEHENHDQAMEALQIEKFPTNAAEKFSSHKELDSFLKDLSPRETQDLGAEELMVKLREFRNLR